MRAAILNFYSHHINDFRSATRHLTRVEISVYRDLIDLYYETEQPLKFVSTEALARRVLCKTDEEIAALKSILEEFFVLTEAGYSQSRCDEEIEKYRANTSAKALAGKASAAAKKARKQANQHNSTPVEIRTNETQLTNNQEPITNNFTKDKSFVVPYEKILQAYDENCPMLPAVVKLSDKRKRLIKNCWQFFINPKNLNPQTQKPWATDTETGLIIFNKFFEAVGKSDFLCGRIFDKSGKPFTGCGLEWLMTESNFLKVIEGNYKNFEAQP